MSNREMQTSPLDSSTEVETAEDIERKLDAVEIRLVGQLGIDRRQLRSEILRMLQAGEISEYEHGGLVADWLYYRSAMIDRRVLEK